jgi:endogenous inhibitor of DNA gyrase (YacG/DUF329 family)
MPRSLNDENCPMCGYPADMHFAPYCSYECKGLYETAKEYGWVENNKPINPDRESEPSLLSFIIGAGASRPVI